LYRFAFKPLTKVMGERTAKIEKSLEEAKKIEVKLAKTEDERQEILKATKKEANDLLAKAIKDAEDNQAKIISEAKAEALIMMNKEKERLDLERAKSFQELKSQVVDLVIETSTKVLQEKMKGAKDRDYIISKLKD
jgi:F-type H+-transporting ATPase subunit b